MPKALNVGLLLVDVALGTILFRLLRARYVDARRERKFARGAAEPFSGRRGGEDIER